MGGQNEVLLYTANRQYDGLMRAIGMGNKDYDSAFFGYIAPPFSMLEGRAGVVFVGPQTSVDRPSVFQSYDDYFAFIDAAHERDLLVVAAINRGLRLPYQSRGIDHTIFTNRTEKTIKDVTIEVTRYFLRNGLSA